MSNSYFFKVFLFATAFAVCQAGLVQANSLGKAETKAAACPGFLQGDTAVPCWPLNGKCYCFSKTNRVTWLDADQFCRVGGMTLLSLESKEEDQMINNHIKSTPELSDDYYWISGKFSNNRWEWATNEPLTYTHWYTGEPSNSQAGSFVYINYLFPNGIWFDETGPAYILFICESIADEITTVDTQTTEKDAPTEPTTTDATTIEPVLTTTEETQETTRPEEITTEASETTTTAGETKPTTCPDHLHGNGSMPCWTLSDKCYCFSKFARNWTGADSFCKEGGMTLLKIETEQENVLVYDHYTHAAGMNKDIYWTAGRYSQEGQNRWEWATTQPYQPLSYTNWNPNKPVQPDFNKPGYCMDISFAARGYWSDSLCTTSMKFICESK